MSVDTVKNNLNHIVVLLALICTLILYFLPENVFNSTLNESKCLHQIWFSKPCPGCGMTRAFYYSIHFNFEKAIKLNPSIVIFLLCSFQEILYRIKKTKWNTKTRLISYGLLCISLFITYFTRLIY
jgi:hypothetical protein